MNERVTRPPRCSGSQTRVPNESSVPETGWGECRVCGNGFYTTAPVAGKVTIPTHSAVNP